MIGKKRFYIYARNQDIGTSTSIYIKQSENKEN